MRALLVCSEFPPGPGGIGTHAFELSRGLARLGWQVRVHAPQDYADEEEIAAFARNQLALEQPRLELDRAPRQNGAWRKLTNPAVRALSLRRSLAQARPDVVIASGRSAVWLCASMRFSTTEQPRGRRRVPWVALGHGSEFGNPDKQNSLRARITRYAYSQADSVICVSEFTRTRMHAAGIRPRAESVIPNGADPTQFPLWPPERIAAWRAGHGLAGKRVLLTLGHVSERKGQDLVVRALPRILERVPSAVYVAVGLPTRVPHLQALARELGVADAVRFPGRAANEERLAWLHAADVFVLTSRSTTDGDCEGYGIAAVEAAFCNVPAVVAAGSGLAEAVVHQATGFVVPPESPAAIADAVRALCTEEDKRRRMGEVARARALNEQTWEQRVQAYDAWLRARVQLARGETVRGERAQTPTAAKVEPVQEQTLR